MGLGTKGLWTVRRPRKTLHAFGRIYRRDKEVERTETSISKMGRGWM